MDCGIDRNEALALLREHLSQTNLFNHSLASEAVMRELAVYFGEDEELWGLAGLLHDLDAETEPDLATHTQKAAEILRGRGVAEVLVEAICLHNESAWPGTRRQERLHHALAAAETLTGLIVATALVYPDRRLASVADKSVRKRYKERQFAAGASRETIAECEKIGIPLDDFCRIGLTAMQKIAGEIGL